MTKEENPIISPIHLKENNLDLRIILIGDAGVGKKSLVQRFKLINCTETRNINFSGFFRRRKRKNFYKKSKKEKKEDSTKTKKDTTYQSIDSADEDLEEEKLREYKEEKRINCMKFIKRYNLGYNFIEISYFPCAEEEPLPYDYELKEEDEFFEFEKENRVSIRTLVKEIEAIILKPSEDSSTRVEVLFLLCFDLSNLSSFEKLVKHFSQIQKHFQLNNDDYKIALIGNKMDKRVPMNNEESEKIEAFKTKYNLNYYETSSLMFYNFDIFFEKLILDKFGNLPILKHYENKFHEIIYAKKSFPKTKRPPFGGDDNPPANKYDNNPFSYPDNEKDFKKMFFDRDKYNKHIFVNKRAMLYPPIKNLEKDILKENSKKKSLSTDKKAMIISWDTAKRDKVKASLELQSNITGYTFGVKTYKPLGLFKEREKLRKIRDKQKIDALGGNIILMDGKRTITEENIEENQMKYEKNRKNQRDRILEETKIRNDDLKERHDEVNERNILSYNEKMNGVKDKQDKYSKLYEEKEKNKEKIQNENYYKNNIKSPKKFLEPKCRFYDPVSSIATDRGFTFGKKYIFKDKDIYSPEFPTFLDDFEKLIEKNKKRIVLKHTGSKFPENKSIEVGDSSSIMDKMKIFEKRRLNHKKNLLRDFLEDRKYKKDNVITKKIDIKTNQEKYLQEQIQKTYNNDPNYLIRDINYDQVESNSPSFTIRAKYNFGSIFQNENNDRDYELSTPNRKQSNFENPNFSLIRPRYPAFSFGTSQRFKSISIEGRNSRANNLLNKYKDQRYETEGNSYTRNNNLLDSLYYYGSQDSQSFLKMQTTMGTGKKLFTKDNGVPGPNQYLIKGFADEVKTRGNKINETRIKLKEKKVFEELEKKRMAKLREERFEEKKKALKMSLKEILYGNDNLTNGSEKIEPTILELNSERKNETNLNENEDNNSKDE